MFVTLFRKDLYDLRSLGLFMEFFLALSLSSISIFICGVIHGAG